jgi:hypothetical protein
MVTIHSALIDYRFRQLMSYRNMKSKKVGGQEFDMIDIPKIDEFIQEEEQTYVLNGILVESKCDTDEERQKQKQRMVKQYM